MIKTFIQFTFFLGTWTKANSLPSCSANVSSVQLCEKSGETFLPYKVPKAPRPIDIIVDVKNVISVDHNKNTFSIYVYMITQWTNPSISFVAPKGQK